MILEFRFKLKLDTSLEEERDKYKRKNKDKNQIYEPWRNYNSIHGSNIENAANLVHCLVPNSKGNKHVMSKIK